MPANLFKSTLAERITQKGIVSPPEKTCDTPPKEEGDIHSELYRISLALGISNGLINLGLLSLSVLEELLSYLREQSVGQPDGR